MPGGPDIVSSSSSRAGEGLRDCRRAPSSRSLDGQSTRGRPADQRHLAKQDWARGSSSWSLLALDLSELPGRLKPSFRVGLRRKASAHHSSPVGSCGCAHDRVRLRHALAASRPPGFAMSGRVESSRTNFFVGPLRCADERATIARQAAP